MSKSRLAYLMVISGLLMLNVLVGFWPQFASAYILGGYNSQKSIAGNTSSYLVIATTGTEPGPVIGMGPALTTNAR